MNRPLDLKGYRGYVPGEQQIYNTVHLQDVNGSKSLFKKDLMVDLAQTGHSKWKEIDDHERKMDNRKTTVLISMCPSDPEEVLHRDPGSRTIQYLCRR